jgi:hypothetical protein
MVAFNKFYCFVEDVAEKKHDCANDVFKILLSNTAPDLTDRLVADMAEIAAGNGYAAGGNAAAVSDSSRTLGVYKLTLADPVAFQATGGAMAPFRYAILYNATAGLAIGWWDYGSALTLQAGEALAVDLDAAAGVLTIQ